MRKMNYQNVRGTVDYLPEQEQVRRKVRRTLEDTFISYGCKPLETPILNYTELMASKYAGGAEILQEMYTLTDRGERDLALRYDLTIPFAKVVAMNPHIPMPFKRYEIGKVFRDGPIKAGRFREFTQCDVDIVGVKSQAAEAELMQMAVEAFKQLKLDIVIQYNNRKLLFGLLQCFNVQEDQMNRVILTIDKMEKIDRTTLIKELQEQQLARESILQIESFLDSEPNYAYFEQYTKDNDFVAEGLNELKELTSLLDSLGISSSCQFNPFLARGLEIYTGTIYELFLKDGAIRSSIGSGGRYDNAIGGLIEMSLDGEKANRTMEADKTSSFATVGISFGLDVIYTALELSGRIEIEPTADFYIIPLGTEAAALQLALNLRQNGWKVEVELGEKKLRKAMEKANRERYPKVIVLGENEVASGAYAIKDMCTGESERVAFTFNSFLVQ